ncbi:MAG: hypothetical protein ACI391_00310, partial [Muribaculaceae bacterium]
FAADGNNCSSTILKDMSRCSITARQKSAPRRGYAYSNISLSCFWQITLSSQRTKKRGNRRRIFVRNTASKSIRIGPSDVVLLSFFISDCKFINKFHTYHHISHFFVLNLQKYPPPSISAYTTPTLQL